MAATVSALTMSAPQQVSAGSSNTSESPQQAVSGEDAVNALNSVFGRHAKERGSHAKGFCVKGEFVPTEKASDETTVGLFRHKSIPVTGRFSIGGGNPKASDKSRSVRGMAVRLYPDGEDMLDLVMISAPVFFAATPEQFVEFLKVRTPDPKTGEKNPKKIAAFNARNPNVMTHLNYLSKTPPPASYASTPYFSTHAFLIDLAEGRSHAARWHFEPVGGFVGLTQEQESHYPDTFLESELNARLIDSSAEWTAYLQLAGPDDDVNDPSAEWAETRSSFIEVGHLKVTETIAQGSAEDCTPLVFDPNNLPDGINPTNDPILALRRPAYSVSLSRRVQ